MIKHFLLDVIMILLWLNPCQLSSQTIAPVPLHTAISENNNDSHKVLIISYIGNMGVLLEANQHTVLIDGLHQYYKPIYEYPTHETVKQLIKGEYPSFSEIEVILVSHKHKNHFSPGHAYDFLRYNSEAILVGSSQLLEEMERVSKGKEKELLDRVEVVPYSYNINQVTHKGIEVESFRCDHTNPARHKNIENIAHMISMGQYNILHLGDTDRETLNNLLPRINLVQRDLDILVLPFWMLLVTSSVVDPIKKLNPKKIIATHMAPINWSKTVANLEKDFSNVICFTKVNEKIYLRK